MNSNSTAIADTGASDHYFTPTAPVINITTGSKPAILRTATGELKQSTASAHLAIQGIPTNAARTVHIIPGFTNNLLSLGKLCDADCTAKLDKHNLTIYNKEGRQIEQQGARLWRVNIAPTPANIIEPDEASINETATPAPTRPQISTPRAPTQPQPTMQPETMQPVESTMQPNTTRPPQQQRATSTKVARSYDLPNTPALVAYLHATAGYPVKSTWLAAIKRGAYHTWPGLTYDLAARYCPEAQETQQGHMAQPRQHIRSTQPTTGTPRIATTPEIQPAHPEINIQVITANQLFTDDTGRFTPTAATNT